MDSPCLEEVVSRIMVTRHACAALALALLGLAGCTQPVPNVHGLVLPESAAPVTNWDASAHTMAMSLEAQGMIETPAHPTVQGQLPYPGPYYLFVQQPGSTFLQQARNKLEYELLRSGAAVVRSPVGATVINLNAAVIRQTVLWTAMIVSNSRVLMTASDQFYISYSDAGLYHGGAALAPLASPGVSLLGAAVPLNYAR
jgi:hypothetical protein